MSGVGPPFISPFWSPAKMGQTMTSIYLFKAHMVHLVSCTLNFKELMTGRLTGLLLLCAMGKSIGKPWYKELGGTVEKTDFPSLKESTIDAESPRPRSEVLRLLMWLSDNLQCRKHRFDPWARKIWRRKWQPTPVFLPGKWHGQRSLVGYSLWGCKESDTTERLIMYAPVCVVSTHSM